MGSFHSHFVTLRIVDFCFCISQSLPCARYHWSKTYYRKHPTHMSLPATWWLLSTIPLMFVMVFRVWWSQIFHSTRWIWWCDYRPDSGKAVCRKWLIQYGSYSVSVHVWHSALHVETAVVRAHVVVAKHTTSDWKRVIIVIVIIMWSPLGLILFW